MSIASVSTSLLLRAIKRSFDSSNFKSISNPKLFSSKIPPRNLVKEVDPDTGLTKTKKTAIIPKITLVSGNSVTVTTMHDAERLSRRRDLKLVKVTDSDIKTERPVYKMMTPAEYHAEDLKQRQQKVNDRQNIKGEKVLLLSSKIAFHDLETQLRRAMKWVQKSYEVRVVISGAGGNVENAEKIFESIEKYFRKEEPSARILNKRTKGSDVRFQIAPPKPVTENERHASL